MPRLLSFQSPRPTDAITSELQASLRETLQPALKALEDARALLARVEQRVELATNLTEPDHWFSGPGWLSHVTATYTDMFYRSPWSVGDSRGFVLGLGFDRDWGVWSHLHKQVAPTLAPGVPFTVRVRRPSGEILDGPTAISVSQYRRFRAIARQEGGSR